MTDQAQPARPAHIESLVDGLTRTQIVQYAGASGDFNPIHTDERYATEAARLATVMAHGMLTMGMVGEAVGRRFGQQRISRFGGRFCASVWPGDVLTLSISAVTDSTETEERVTLTVTNQDDIRVFEGYALLRDLST
jgi:acyl dehydratase